MYPHQLFKASCISNLDNETYKDIIVGILNLEQILNDFFRFNSWTKMFKKISFYESVGIAQIQMQFDAKIKFQITYNYSLDF